MNGQLRMGALDRSIPARALRRGLGFAHTLTSDPQGRRAFWLRLTRPANLFQPYGETLPDRYPELFGFARSEIGDSPDVRLLSFGCARGDEVVSLRLYFALATIKGIDISRGNIKECRRRRDLANDPRVEFARAGGAQGEPPSHYDAIFCMAVFRHGDLTGQGRQSCADLISFDAFESTVAGLSKCLKPGALLVVEHSNFRFEDTATSQAFECIRRRARADWERERTPLFGPDNLAIPSPEEIGTVFRKRAT